MARAGSGSVGLIAVDTLAHVTQDVKTTCHTNVDLLSDHMMVKWQVFNPMEAGPLLVLNKLLREVVILFINIAQLVDIVIWNR
jgi:hypothetical protein